MEVVIRCLILSLVMAIICIVYFSTFTEQRWKSKWMPCIVLAVYAAGFMVIALTEIPPYILQPVRTIAVLFLATQLCYRIKAGHNVMLSTLFCAFLWGVNLLVITIVLMLPRPYFHKMQDVMDFIWEAILLCLVLLFHKIYKGKEGIRALAGTDWGRFGYFPVFSMAVIMAISMIDWNAEFVNVNIFLIVITGFGIINIFAFYFITSIVTREMEVGKLLLIQERTRNQMNIYRNMQENYESQRKYMHDYKNQLNCIQGLITDGRIAETLDYIGQITGSLKQNMACIETNHPVVDVVLNQKYNDAQDRNITMVIQVNDLSGVTISEEDMVTLLVNLLDNAIEACEKLDSSRVIQLKITMEENQFILSIRNPVNKPLNIKGKTMVSTKKNPSKHGIGLLNVNSVIEKNGGTSVIKCDEGWFYFSAMIPVLK